ncbi:Intersectin 1 (SH3 domain protein) [Mycoemilia scoparia]|uniref:Intersectin 1 (SH3 domain protein) n=1 Tax=Mycoemilia scoparia TaxID=417184 RepID=A0A9W7ZV30_9FUNG|nr:Intersectin 1 (SH3 domain protein) [Mycoemilia scoparia]
MRANALFTCQADNPGEVSFNEGDVFENIDITPEIGWLIGTQLRTKERGLIPAVYVELFPEVGDDELTKEMAAMGYSITKPAVPTKSTKPKLETLHKDTDNKNPRPAVKSPATPTTRTPSTSSSPAIPNASTKPKSKPKVPSGPKPPLSSAKSPVKPDVSFKPRLARSSSVSGRSGNEKKGISEKRASVYGEGTKPWFTGNVDDEREKEASALAEWETKHRIRNSDLGTSTHLTKPKMPLRPSDVRRTRSKTSVEFNNDDEALDSNTIYLGGFEDNFDPTIHKPMDNNNATEIKKRIPPQVPPRAVKNMTQVFSPSVNGAPQVPSVKNKPKLTPHVPSPLTKPSSLKSHHSTHPTLPPRQLGNDSPLLSLNRNTSGIPSNESRYSSSSNNSSFANNVPPARRSEPNVNQFLEKDLPTVQTLPRYNITEYIDQKTLELYKNKFSEIDGSARGYLTGDQSLEVLIKSRLSNDQLAQIWKLSDRDLDGNLTLPEFILAMYFCDSLLKEEVLPECVPLDLLRTAYTVS